MRTGNKTHFVVVYKITIKHVFIADPFKGLVKCNKEEFISNWAVPNDEDNTIRGVILTLNPTQEFYSHPDEVIKKVSLASLFNFSRFYKPLVGQLLMGLLIGSLLQVILPFLAKGIIDSGIEFNDLNFIYLILIGQLTVILGKTAR